MNPQTTPMPESLSTSPEPPRLLDQLARAARAAGNPEPNVSQIATDVRRYVLFHGKRHPRELGRPEVARYLQHVATTAPEPLVAIEMARSAIDLLYRSVLGIDLGELPRPAPPRLLDRVAHTLEQ